MEERKRLRHGELRGEAGGSLPRGEGLGLPLYGRRCVLTESRGGEEDGGQPEELRGEGQEQARRRGGGAGRGKGEGEGGTADH